MNTRKPHGGTFLGFVLGLVVGLVVALGVAVYVTKVPTPFSNKVQNRSPEQDAAENQKNKDWNPNSVLQPKAPAVVPSAPDASAPAGESKALGQPDTLGDVARNKPVVEAEDEAFQYFVQVGAYRSAAEAEAQKAKMAMLGLEAKVSERDQAGRPVFRVRLGPFGDKAGADRVRERLQAANVEHTVVRSQR